LRRKGVLGFLDNLFDFLQDIGIGPPR